MSSVDATNTLVMGGKAARERDRGRIAELATQIQDLECSIQLLQAEKDLAQKRLDSYAYPLLTLPNEILSEIFVQFLPVYPRPPPLTGLLSPTLLAHICRTWRGIAHATPALWRAISLDFDTSCDEQDNKHLGSWMTRSHSYPISICIDAEDAVPSACAATLAAHRARWEYLKLFWISKSTLPFLSKPMPLLRHLDVSFQEDFEPITAALGDVPLLRSLRIGYYSNCLVLPWRQLTSLALESTYLDETILILQQTALLVHCELALFLRGDERDDQPKLELHFLQSLTLIGNKGEPAPVLDMFILPALRTLQVPEIDLGPYPIPELASFISQSRCSLRELRITGKRFGMVPDKYRKAFPTISRITFDSGKPFEGILRI
ncbi:hypothetical protein C8R43DRAFT_315123 [Mycena crocata]|nr:hypothetical protein C8R43DRAFT_315123 [Mycena crocata]